MTDQQQDSLSERRQRRTAVTLSVLLVYQAVFVFAVAFFPSRPPSSLPDVAAKFIAAGMLTLVLPTYFLLPLVCVAVALRLRVSGSRILVLIGIQILLSIGMTFVLLPPVSG